MNFSFPDLFKNEEELRKIWSNPITRKEFLKRLFDLGIDLEQLDNIQKVVNAEDCDLFDVLSYLSYSTPLITRQQRIANSKENTFVRELRAENEALKAEIERRKEINIIRSLHE